MSDDPSLQPGQKMWGGRFAAKPDAAGQAINSIGRCRSTLRPTPANRYNGIACNLRNAKSGEYGGVRNFWMVTRGRPRRGNPIQKFITWVQNSARAQEIVGKHWVPLK